MPRDLQRRVEVSEDEDEEVRRNIMTDGDSEAMELKPEQEPEAVEQAGDGEDPKKEEGDDEDEEVYEIEQIIHHKKNMFGKSTGFFVKWKGYPVSDNSWVKEEDCNAPDLIRDYYLNPNPQPEEKKKKRRGSEKPRSQKKRDEDTDMEQEKDIRPKKAKKNSTTKASGKPTKTNGRTSLRAVDKDADTDTDMIMEPDLGRNEHAQHKYGTMDDYRDEKEWDHLIEEVLTVDYANDASRSVVYFLRLKNGEHRAATGEWMSRKAAKTALRFFESNLRFREGSDEA